MEKAYDDLLVFLDDITKKYKLRDDELAWLLLQMGVNYYFRSIANKILEERKEKDEQQ